MSRHVNTISYRLSRRPPQRRSLEILDRLAEILPLRKDQDTAAALETVRSEFPQVEDFGRDFPSLCFALATGVGKTRRWVPLWPICTSTRVSGTSSCSHPT